MSGIANRGDSPAFFNKGGSLSQEEDLVFYRDASGKMIFKDESQTQKSSQIQDLKQPPKPTKP